MENSRRDDEEESIVSTVNTSIGLESSLEDRQEEDRIATFVRETCGCRLGPNKQPCCVRVSESTIRQTRNNCFQMSKQDLDLIVMAQINVLRTHSMELPTPSEQFRPSTKYFMHGIPICQTFFRFLHILSSKRYKNICAALDKGGVTERVHGNKFEDTQRVKKFIANTAETHALPLPGRLPNQKDKFLLLPTDMPKMKVYRNYKAVCESDDVPHVGKSKFYSLWQELCPYISTMKPSSDLCFQCQQNSNMILRSAHMSEEEKSMRLQVAVEHLQLAKTERAFYNQQIEDQNKNNAFIHYLMWRVANGKNSSISLSFMIAGHTKFAPDRHFGLIRKTYRRTPVETINCLERVVRNSSTIGCNISQLVRSPSGELLVNYYDWTSYFKDYFKAIPAITKYHVFCCSHDDPGVIYLRETSQSEEISLSLVKKSLPPQDCFPEQILPKGLDIERQWYLYERIRPFCLSNLSADLTCPKPQLPKTQHSQPSRQYPTDDNITSSTSPLPRAGTKRCCSVCKGSGHTKRTCPSRNNT